MNSTRRLLLLAALASVSAFAAPPGPSTATAAKPVNIAVVYFDVLSQNAELSAFSKGLAAMMITDLTNADPGLKVLERDRLEAILGELKLGETKYSDPSNLAKIGKLLGVDFIVTGSLIRAANVSSIELKLFSVPTSEVKATARVKMKDDDVFTAEQGCVEAVLKNLDRLKGSLSFGSRGTLPFASAVKYSLALDAKDKKDKPTATRLLKEVVVERPEFALAKLDLMTLTE
ncbi:MAG: CsgG/HfaB family protein [Archangium sp.]